MPGLIFLCAFSLKTWSQTCDVGQEANVITARQESQEAQTEAVGRHKLHFQKVVAGDMGCQEMLNLLLTRLAN